MDKPVHSANKYARKENARCNEHKNIAMLKISFLVATTLNTKGRAEGAQNNMV
ncbi:hypothetical protein GCM10007877_29350 [Marinibactrum halimedae]|uniref:Uncharacterized protein n=1 Tax=Marinibactrum halimedae TaxID=1444977 RepID=A0AA37WPQ0_9GAMM|nr:hypothetical protein GCM10007877_29350 [Marinibactrum halimedae]